MWTLFASVVLVVIGIFTVGEWLAVWWKGEKLAFSTRDFAAAVEARFPAVASVRVFEAPSLSRTVGWMKVRPAVDRFVLLTDADGARIAVDVSWLGRFTLEESLLRLTVDLLAFDLADAPESKKKNRKGAPRSDAKILVGVNASSYAGTSLRAGLLSNMRGGTLLEKSAEPASESTS